MTRTILALALLIASLGLARAALAEEVFVLGKGTVVRGTAIREMEDRIVVRLSGTFEENTLTLRRSEIQRRYLLRDVSGARPEVASDVEAPADALPLQGRPGVPVTIQLAADGSLRAQDAPADADLPVGERSLESEGFFERLRRVTSVAFPSALEGRLLVGLLLIIVLATLVAGGTQLLGMKAASLQASTTLGILLGVFLMADIFMYEEMLRADRALWIIPLQAGIWLAVARGSLDAPLARTVPLLALMLFASTCFVFATGSLLVSV